MECGFACDGEIVTKSRRKTIRSTAEPKFQKGIFRGTRCNCWKAPGFVDIVGAVGSQHEDNRFALDFRGDFMAEPLLDPPFATNIGAQDLHI
jgi:hypothetical protein